MPNAALKFLLNTMSSVVLKAASVREVIISRKELLSRSCCRISAVAKWMAVRRGCVRETIPVEQRHNDLLVGVVAHARMARKYTAPCQQFSSSRSMWGWVIGGACCSAVALITWGVGQSKYSVYMDVKVFEEALHPSASFTKTTTTIVD